MYLSTALCPRQSCVFDVIYESSIIFSIPIEILSVSIILAASHEQTSGTNCGCFETILNSAVLDGLRHCPNVDTLVIL